MKYELAKQLRDVGFPQLTKEFFVWGPPQKNEDYRNIMNIDPERGYTNLLAAGYEVIACPNLSELIKACEDGFFKLSHYKDSDWGAEVIIDINGLVLRKGSTPEEAVAKLWLELNGK